MLLARQLVKHEIVRQKMEEEGEAEAQGEDEIAKSEVQRIFEVDRGMDKGVWTNRVERKPAKIRAHGTNR